MGYKKLSELGYFYGGLSGKNKNDFTDGNARYITYKNIFSNKSVDLNCSTMVKIAVDEKQNTVGYGDVLFTGSSETREECGIASVVTNRPNEKIYLNSFCFGLRMHDQNLFNPNFLKHLFNLPAIRNQITKTANGVTRFNISKVLMASVKVPVPPIEVQNEIADILDNFAQLTAELEAELEARKKQYEYYLNYLIFNNKIPTVCLNTIARYSKEKVINSELNKDTYVGVDNLLQNRMGKKPSAYVPEIGMSSKYKQGDILLGNIRPYLKKIWFADNSGGASGDVLILNVLDRNVDKKYLYYVLSSDNFFVFNTDHSKGAKMPRGSKEMIMKFPVPIPPPEIQKQIAETLDSFDKLVHGAEGILEGLPKEIELSRKRYEYFRDKLLTFN